jgi:hypothetical protein
LRLSDRGAFLRITVGRLAPQAQSSVLYEHGIADDLIIDQEPALNARHAGLALTAVILIGLLAITGSRWRNQRNTDAGLTQSAVPSSSGTSASDAGLPDQANTSLDAPNQFARPTAARFDPKRSPFGDTQKAMEAVDMRVRSLEDRLVSEPVSAQWAASNERAITTYLASDASSKSSDVDAECRSDICRIRLVVAEPDNVPLTLHGLFSQLSDTLPGAEIFQFPRADGTVEVVVYAMSKGS